MDQAQLQIQQNKAIRGYIMRALAGSAQNALLCKMIAAMLINDRLIAAPDIANHLEYLSQKGYIIFLGKNNNSANAMQNDAAIQLTAKGTDLIEGSIDDPGVVI